MPRWRSNKFATVAAIIIFTVAAITFLSQQTSVTPMQARLDRACRSGIELLSPSLSYVYRLKYFQTKLSNGRGNFIGARYKVIDIGQLSAGDGQCFYEQIGLVLNFRRISVQNGSITKKLILSEHPGSTELEWLKPSQQETKEFERQNRSHESIFQNR